MKPPKPVRVTDDELGDFLTQNTIPVDSSGTGGLVSRFGGFLIGSVIVGLAVGALGVPAVIVTTAVTEKLVDEWSKLPESLPIDHALPQHTILLDKDGVEFARFLTEDRVDVDRVQISETFANALMASEDRRFKDHNGIDFIGIGRAIVSNLAGNALQGGSTITQQYVQNILISNARDDTERAVAVGDTIQSKLHEAKYAVWLEKELTKDEILSGYANAVFLGNHAYGVESASRTYFSTTAANLTVPQSALLVAMLKAPVAYDPFVYPDAAIERRNIVINAMAEEKYITAEEAAAATATGLDLVPGQLNSGCVASEYPQFCALVQQEILTDSVYGATDADRQETLRRGGLTIRTTLDRNAANIAQNAATNALKPDNRVGTGVAVIVPGTGHIAAVAQNHPWSQTQIVYATSKMQPGSVMKPVALAAALESGFDIGTKFKSNGPYKPNGMDAPGNGFTNSGGANPGTINAPTAIKQSVNVYFVKLTEKVGVKRIAQVGHQLGLNSLPSEWSGREAAIALGTYEVSPLEIADVYATFAAGGIHCEPTTISSAAYTATGAPAPAPDTACTQVLSPGVASQMNSALQGTFTAGGTLSGVGSLPGRVAGGKTGTTDGSSAVWTAGMTPQFATAVWVGDPRGGQANPLINVTAYGARIGQAFGASIAGPIWKETMVNLHRGLAPVDFGAVGQVGFPSDTRQRVPNLVGISLDAAVSILADAGLSVTVKPDTAGDDRYTPGIITAQSVAAGQITPAGRSISVTLSPGSDTDVHIEPAK
jgi:membrane peptidoglycan carboxypeptidase